MDLLATHVPSLMKCPGILPIFKNWNGWGICLLKNKNVLWIFLPTLCLPIHFLSVVYWSLLFQIFILWLLLSTSYSICLHAISITRLWIPRGKECEHFLSCAPQPPAQILTHEYRSSEEEINIPFSVYYLSGESSSTLIIQFFWFTWRWSFSNPSLGMDTWPKLGQLKLCPGVLQEIGTWRDTHPAPIKIHKDIVMLKQLLAIFVTTGIDVTWVWSQHRNWDIKNGE